MPISLLSGLDRRPLSRSGHRKRPQNPGDARFFPEPVPRTDISPPARPHRPRNRVRKGRSRPSGTSRAAIRRPNDPISARLEPHQGTIAPQNGTLCRADPGIEGGGGPPSDARIALARLQSTLVAFRPHLWPSDHTCGLQTTIVSVSCSTSGPEVTSVRARQAWHR